jgi:hypothetical protein
LKRRKSLQKSNYQTQRKVAIKKHLVKIFKNWKKGREVKLELQVPKLLLRNKRVAKVVLVGQELHILQVIFRHAQVN